MNDKNEINFEKTENSDVENGLKIDHSVQEKKLIQRKRKCDTPRNYKTNLDEDEGYMTFYKSSNRSMKSEIKQGPKRKSKRGNMEYAIPIRIPFKSSECLVSLIDRVILKLDPLQLLRGYRSKLKNLRQFNDFSSRKIEKFLNFKNNSGNLSFVNFCSDNFDLVVFRNEKFFNQNENSMISENLIQEINPSTVQDKEKITVHSEIHFCEKNGTNKDIILKMPNEISEKTLVENRSKEISSNLIYSENLENHLNMNLLNQELYEEIETKFKDKVIGDDDMTDIDVLRYKAEMNYYTNINDFIKDINLMMKSIYKNLNQLLMNTEKSEDADNNQIQIANTHIYLAKSYLTSTYIDLVKKIEEIKPSFRNLYDSDIKILLENNKLPRVNITEFRNLPLKKEYQEIKEYEHIFPERTKSKTSSTILSNCNGLCCECFEDLGPLNLEKSRWDSKCTDRIMNVECNPENCGCNVNTCKNMAILTKTNKILGKDVIEKYSWGIDLYTYRNLIEFLPLNFSDEIKSGKFIEKTLIKTLCDLDTKGYSIKKGCEQIIKTWKSDSKEIQNDIFFASHLLSVYKNSKNAKKNSSHAYSKGIGIFCMKKEGIKKNELIAPYLGEIYPPWYWYEKQDLIKKNKLDKVLPDFYNIMLERHKSDDKGYDLVMVDPNSKGNFASRMSHSCHPNCNTVLMSSGNEYTIGMYATNNISFGDELTFDYNSVTEKEKEFQDAICLCSSFNCRGHYLIYSNSNLFTEILSDYHTFLHRNSILLKACDLNFENNSLEELTESDGYLLNKYSIRSSILEKAPFWLKKWAALILRYVEFESKQLPIILYKNSKNEDRLRLDAEVENDSTDFKDIFERNNEKIRPIKNCNNVSSNLNNFEHEEESTIIEKMNSVDKKLRKEKLSMSSLTSSKQKFDFNTNFIFPGVKKYESSRRRVLNSKTEFIENDQKESILIEKEKIENTESFPKPYASNDNLINGLKIDEENEEIEKQSKAIGIILGEIEMEDSNKHKSLNGGKEYRKSIEVVIKNSHYEENIQENDSYQKIPSQHITDNNPIVVPEEYRIEDDDLKEYKNQVAGITENRIQNIAITIDKIIHVLNLMKTHKPPLVIINEKEVYEHYWGRNYSIKENLLTNFDKILKCPEFKTISNELNSNIQKIIQILQATQKERNQNKDHDYASYNKLVRENLRQISILCRNCIKLDKSNKFIFYEGLADILYLYSSTKTYFKHDSSYEKGAESELSFIRRRDISTTSTGEDLDEAIHKDRKYYDKLYIWGQLIGWYKQTVDKPNASLSAERRGTLSYPEIDSFFVYFDDLGKKAKNEVFKYPINPRKKFFEKILESPSQMWPVGNFWSFKNKNKIYGTVQFDSINSSKNPFDNKETKSYLLQIFKNMNNNS